jgi:hypothetical protein
MTSHHITHITPHNRNIFLVAFHYLAHWKMIEIKKSCCYIMRKISIRLFFQDAWCNSFFPLCRRYTELTPWSWVFLEKPPVTAAQEFPNILWNPKVHYRVHKSPSLVPIVSHINPVHTNPSYFSKIHFNIILSRLDLLNGPFTFDIPTKPLCALLFSHACYVPSHWSYN